MMKPKERPTTQSSKQVSILSFGRIAKPCQKSTTVSKTSKDNYAIGVKQTVGSKVATPSRPVTLKRKRVQEASDDCGTDFAQTPAHEPKRTRLEVQQTADVGCDFEATKILHTPQKTRANPQHLPTPEATPTKPRSPAPLSAKNPERIIPQASSSTLRLRRGQLLLTDLKGLARAAQAGEAKTLEKKTTFSRADNKHRASLLLSRLQEKQTALANAPSPPSKEELAYCGALQRVPDIVKVLAQAPGYSEEKSQRQSWALQSLVTNVKQSARSVLGDDEIERCLRVIEEDGEKLGCPGFVRFRSFGIDKHAVVVDSRFRPLDVALRVKQLLKDVGN